MRRPTICGPRYNVCPTDLVDVVTAEEGKRELVPMRWGLIPRWWSKTIKEAKIATFNARAETIRNRSFATRSNAPAVSFQCRAIMSGRMLREESRLGISLREMARRS